MLLSELPQIAFAQFEGFIRERLEHNPAIRDIALKNLRRPYPARTSYPDGDDGGGENNLGWIEKLVVQFILLRTVDRTVATAALVGAIGWIKAYKAVPRDAGHTYIDGVLLALDVARTHPDLINDFVPDTGMTAAQLATLCEQVLRKSGSDMSAKLDAYKQNRQGKGTPYIRYVSNALKTCADCARAAKLIGDIDWQDQMIAAVRKHAHWFTAYPFEHVDYAIGWGQAADGTWFQCDLIERTHLKWGRPQPDGTTSPRTGYQIPYQRHFTQFEALYGILEFLEADDANLARDRMDQLETQWWEWDYLDNDNAMHRGTGPTQPIPVFHPLAKDGDPIVLANATEAALSIGGNTGEMLYQFWHYVLRLAGDVPLIETHTSRMLEASHVQGEQHWRTIYPPTIYSEGLLRLCALSIEEEVPMAETQKERAKRAVKLLNAAEPPLPEFAQLIEASLMYEHAVRVATKPTA